MTQTILDWFNARGILRSIEILTDEYNRLATENWFQALTYNSIVNAKESFVTVEQEI